MHLKCCRQYCFSVHQVLCPRCDIGMLNLKRKQKKLKEPVPSGKKKSTKLETLSDLERALSESKDTASAVCGLRFFFLTGVSSKFFESLFMFAPRAGVFSSTLFSLLCCSAEGLLGLCFSVLASDFPKLLLVEKTCVVFVREGALQFARQCL